MTARLRLYALPFFAVALMTSGAAFAQPAKPWLLHDALDLPKAIKLTGSTRARYETIDAQPRPGFASSETLLNLRTILSAEATKERFKVTGELWDSRVYGAESNSAIGTNEVNTFEPVQAYVTADLAGMLGPKSKANLQLGRMMLNLGSRRLVAADDYRNTTNGYTGALFTSSLPSTLAMTAFVATPQIRLPDDGPSIRDNKGHLDKEYGDLMLWGAFVSKREPWFASTVEVSYVGFEEQDAPGRQTRDRDLDNYGLRLIRNPAPHKVDYEFEAIAQRGRISASTAVNAAPLKVEASFLRAHVGYQFADAWKTHLSGEYDWASGDDSDPKFSRFDTLYGMRRGDFSASGILSAVGRSNIASPAVRVEVAPNARTDAMISYRPMYLVSATDSFSTTSVRDATGRSGKHGGDQFDARLRYWLVPGNVRLEGDYTYLKKGRFLREAPNTPADKNDTQYLSLNVTFSF